MATNPGLFFMGALVSMGLVGYGCSGDEGEDDLTPSNPGVHGGLDDPGNGGDESTGQTSTPDDVDPAVFQKPADADGDAAVTMADVIESGAGVPVSQEAVDNFQDLSCAAWQVEPEPLAASLFFVVDASSSMDASANNTNRRPKWDVTREAIAEAIAAMPDGSQVGLLGYPNTVWSGVGGPQCVNTDALFEAQFLGVAREELLGALNAIETEMCTPTHDAYNAAVEAFAAQSTSGQKYILLMTDGQPTIRAGCGNQDGNCSAAIAGPTAEAEVVAAIAAARQEKNIKTFILGSPGSEEHTETRLDNRWWLSEATEAGDTMPTVRACSHTGEPYCHYDMTVETNFADGLNSALADIVGQVAQCDYSIPPPSDGSQQVDRTAIHLVLVANGADYVEVYQAPSSECVHGWYLDGDRVKLCPATCEIVQADPLMELQWLFGCSGISIDAPVT